MPPHDFCFVFRKKKELFQDNVCLFTSFSSFMRKNKRFRSRLFVVVVYKILEIREESQQNLNSDRYLRLFAG